MSCHPDPKPVIPHPSPCKRENILDTETRQLENIKLNFSRIGPYSTKDPVFIGETKRVKSWDPCFKLDESAFDLASGFPKKHYFRSRGATLSSHVCDIKPGKKKEKRLYFITLLTEHLHHQQDCILYNGSKSSV